MKELAESPPVSAVRARFEAGRSFDLDDDLEFCPGLLTEDDVRPHGSFGGRDGGHGGVEPDGQIAHVAWTV